MIRPGIFRAVPQREVNAHRNADPGRADEREDHVGDGLLRAGNASLGDRGGAADREQHFPGAGAGQDGGQADGLVVSIQVILDLGFIGVVVRLLIYTARSRLSD